MEKKTEKQKQLKAKITSANRAVGRVAANKAYYWNNAKLSSLKLEYGRLHLQVTFHL